VLPSLSRLMKDGIGEGYTRADHSGLSNQLFAAYAYVQDARALASVIGAEDLTATDQRYLKFGDAFERQFLSQPFDENRSIEQTLDLGWRLLSMLPREELSRVDDALLEQYYVHEDAGEATDSKAPAADEVPLANGAVKEGAGR
jgi:V/A-type H+-transporting ATPase subunit B